MENSTDHGRSYLVTGASSGIGRACVRRLDKLGYRVFAGVRNPADGERLRREASGQVHALVLDVSREADIVAAVDAVKSELGETRFAGLVNNAGSQISGPLECISSDALRDQLDVNVVGLVATTRAFLPLLRLHTGRVVNVGSTSGRIPSHFLGPYCASKFAVEALTEVMRLEFQPFDVQVAMIEPGVTATPFWQKAASAESELMQQLSPELSSVYEGALAERQATLKSFGTSGESVETVADAVVHALTSRSPKLRYVIGRRAKIRTMLAKYLPESVHHWLMARRVPR